MKKRLCFVVHRYPPFAGGSEYYVAAMAEECVRRGYDVTVFTDYESSIANGGVRNGVTVLHDRNQMFYGLPFRFDLIIVHGADVGVQNEVLSNARFIQAHQKTHVLYLLILPSESPVARMGMSDCSFLGCSTQADFNHATKHGYKDKIVSVRHSIPDKFENVLGEPGIFRKAMGIETKYMILSAGGFWSHKGMDELADIFEEIDRDDMTLVLLGYQNPEFVPPEHKGVRSFICDDRQDVLNAMADADLYIMNSKQEGFGLVLLEAMANKVPWAARHIAGAVELQQYGFTYTKREELKKFLVEFEGKTDVDGHLDIAQNYVKEFRQIGNTVDDIEAVLKKCS